MCTTCLNDEFFFDWLPLGSLSALIILTRLVRQCGRREQINQPCVKTPILSGWRDGASRLLTDGLLTQPTFSTALKNRRREEGNLLRFSFVFLPFLCLPINLSLEIVGLSHKLTNVLGCCNNRIHVRNFLCESYLTSQPHPNMHIIYDLHTDIIHTHLSLPKDTGWKPQPVHTTPNVFHTPTHTHEHRFSRPAHLNQGEASQTGVSRVLFVIQVCKNGNATNFRAFQEFQNHKAGWSQYGHCEV